MEGGTNEGSSYSSSEDSSSEVQRNVETSLYLKEGNQSKIVHRQKNQKLQEWGLYLVPPHRIFSFWPVLWLIEVLMVV